MWTEALDVQDVVAGGSCSIRRLLICEPFLPCRCAQLTVYSKWIRSTSFFCFSPVFKLQPRVRLFQRTVLLRAAFLRTAFFRFALVECELHPNQSLITEFERFQYFECKCHSECEFHTFGPVAFHRLRAHHMNLNLSFIQPTCVNSISLFINRIVWFVSFRPIHGLAARTSSRVSCSRFTCFIIQWKVSEPPRLDRWWIADGSLMNSAFPRFLVSSGVLFVCWQIQLIRSRLLLVFDFEFFEVWVLWGLCKWHYVRSKPAVAIRSFLFG